MSETEATNGPTIEPEGDWYGLYKSGSRDDHLFTTSSTRHPAKMSLALTNKILDTMQEWGWIETGSLVVDPFGGRGTTALCWLARNAANRALTVELEPHFVEMQNRNKEHAERRLHRELAWVILQGDSRRFDEYYAEGKAASVLSAPWERCLNSKPGFSAPHDSTRLMEADYTADSAITSAPYENAVQDKSGIDPTKFRTQGGRYGQTSQAIAGGYQSTASVLSAPYENSTQPGGGEKGARGGDSMRRIKRDYIEPSAAVLSAPYAAAENRRAAGKVQQGEVSDAITRAYDATNHGQTAGNIANLPDACVTSAPYADSQTSDAQRQLSGNKPVSETIAKRKANVGNGNEETSYGTTEGQIARLKDTDACVTSAPFEDSLASDDPEKRGGFLKSDPKRRNDPGLTATYGDAAVTSAPWEKTVATGDPDFLTPGEQGKRVPSKSNMAGYTDAAAVTSAPWEATPGDLKPRPEGVVDQALMNRHGASHGVYADNQQGQIGVLQAESYADACGKVYASLAKAGIRFVCSVTKDPVRKKCLRPLRLLTISLFEQAGYRLVAWRRAWLYHTQAELDAMAGQESLFGDEVEESKRLVGRLSFFRRLSLNRGGIASPYEDCLFFELVAPAEQPEPEKPRWVQPGLF